MYSSRTSSSRLGRRRRRRRRGRRSRRWQRLRLRRRGHLRLGGRRHLFGFLASQPLAREEVRVRLAQPLLGAGKRPRLDRLQNAELFLHKAAVHQRLQRVQVVVARAWRFAYAQQVVVEAPDALHRRLPPVLKVIGENREHVEHLQPRRRAQAVVQDAVLHRPPRLALAVHAAQLDRKVARATAVHPPIVALLLLAVRAALVLSKLAAANREAHRRPRGVARLAAVRRAHAAARARVERQLEVHEPVALHVRAVKGQRAVRVRRRRRRHEDVQPQAVLQDAREPRRHRVRNCILCLRLAFVRGKRQVVARLRSAILKQADHAARYRPRHELRGVLGAHLVEVNVHRGVVDDFEPQHRDRVRIRPARQEADDDRGLAKRAGDGVGVAQRVGALHRDQVLAVLRLQRVGFGDGQRAHLPTDEHRVHRLRCYTRQISRSPSLGGSPRRRRCAAAAPQSTEATTHPKN